MANIKYLKKQLGKKGEKIAINFLEVRGLELIEKNFCIWGGELDLVMKDGEEIVFVEVKTRQSKDIKLEELISKNQQKKLINTARTWLGKKGINNVDWRIDVVGVVLQESQEPKLEWITNAIY